MMKTYDYSTRVIVNGRYCFGIASGTYWYAYELGTMRGRRPTIDENNENGDRIKACLWVQMN